MPSISSVTTGTSRIILNIVGLDDYTSGDCVIHYMVFTGNTNVTSGKTTIRTSAMGVAIGGLSPGTTYLVEVNILQNDRHVATVDSIYVTTEEDTPEPEFSITDYTATSVTIKIMNVPAGNSVRVFIRLAYDTSDETVNSYITSTGPIFYAKYTGLTPSTSYFVNVDPDGTGSDYTWLDRQFFETLASMRPENWSWESTVESGRQIELTFKEWNDFCARINEFRAYKGLEEYSFEKVFSGTPMYAYMIMQARTAIDELPGHGALPPIAVPGGYVSAFIFNELKDALNYVE